MNSMRTLYKKGISVVEIVVASAIISVLLVVVANSFTLIQRHALRNTRVLQASMLAEEGVEALKFMRDYGWNDNIASLTNGSTYRLYWNGTIWVSTTTHSYIDGKYDRTFVLSSVNRDATTFDVVSSGGSADAGSRKAVISVAWREGSATTTKSETVYLFDIFDN